MSPSFSTRFCDGMPCTISWLIEMQTLPGKAVQPLERRRRARVAADELLGDRVEVRASTCPAAPRARSSVTRRGEDPPALAP